MTPQVVEAHQLTAAEYDRIVGLLGREPNYTELGIFSVMWSEHCSYKSSRLHLKKLPTRSKLVVQGRVDELRGQAVARLTELGLPCDDGQSVHLTRAGKCVADSVTTELLKTPQQGKG